MENSRQTDLTNVRSTMLVSSYFGNRLYCLLLVALGLVSFWALPAQGGVEFVTPTNTCNHVDQIGDHKDLFIMAGQNVRFRVFGNSVDLTDRHSGFRIANDSGDGADTNARIIKQGTDCGGTGFALVEVDSPANLSSDIQRSLFFKMPFGDESRLQMTIRDFPPIDVRWDSHQDIGSCLGSFTLLNQSKTLEIRLPPGHQQDETNCDSRTANATIRPAPMSELDISRRSNYAVDGLPNFVSSEQAHPMPPDISANIEFPIDIAGIRALNATSNSILTFAMVSNQISKLRLRVVPNISNGFTQPPNCRNLITGELVNTNDQVGCQFSLAFPPPSGGQRVSFVVTDKECVARSEGLPAGVQVEYSSATGQGHVILPTATGTVFDIPILRALGGQTSQGFPCASLTGVQVTVGFWFGEEDEPNPDRQDTFRIRRSQ